MVRQTLCFETKLVMQENLADLNNKLVGSGQEELPMNRFRPNIVLSGGGSAWSDDGWDRITISTTSSTNNASAGAGPTGDAASVVMQYVRPCSRCKVREGQPVMHIACRQPAIRMLWLLFACRGTM